MPIPENIDTEKLAEAALGMLWLTAHGASYEITRVWKGLDWDVLDLLYEKGWIFDPKSKAKSVSVTEEGEKVAESLRQKHFSK